MNLFRSIAGGLTLALLLLAGCDSGPLRIGFIGGLTGRNADLGLAGRNGALLAVEQRNQAGGVHGRRVELLIGDNAQTPEAAIKATRELIAGQVEAIVGPLTSAMAKVILPVTEQANLVMVSPTVTAVEFAGQDDQFFRLPSTTRDYTRASATFHYHQRGQRRIAVAYDVRNRAFSESTLNDFRSTFSELGGVIPLAIPFESSAETTFADIIDNLLQAQPDALLFIAGAVDTARLAQQARKQAPDLPLIAPEWAATEQLIELGGRAVEGLYLAQFFNRDDPAPRYQAFRKAYQARFQQEPGFASLAAYDATNVVLDALSRRADGQSLKETLLNTSFQGVQQPIAFDRFGDAQRPTFITVVRDGRFVIIE